MLNIQEIFIGYGILNYYSKLLINSAKKLGFNYHFVADRFPKFPNS